MAIHIADPSALNKFDTEAAAVDSAKHWSKTRQEEWTVIHGMGADGLAFFAELGDGGMIRNGERVVARFSNGVKLVD